MKPKEIISILKRLYKEYTKKYLGKLFIALLLSLVVAGSTSGIAYLLDPAVKKIFEEENKTYAWIIPLTIIIVFASKGISLYFARIIVIKVGAKISAMLQLKIAETILFTDLKTMDNRHSGKYISNIMYDAGSVTNLVSTGVLNIMKDSFSLVALVSLMFYQNWKLATFALIMMPLAAFFAKSLGKRIGKVQTEASVKSGNLVKFYTEIFRAAKMIRIYQKEKTEALNAKKVIEESMVKNVKIIEIMIRATPVMEILTGFMIAGFIFYSGKLISAGELDVSSFFSFLAAMMLAYQPIRSLATINMLIYQGTASAKKIFSIIDEPIDVKNDSSLPDLVIDKCNIKFENVSFNYLNSKERAIKKINLDIPGGSMAAFVGHSGAGKSTIINLLPRFYEAQEGKIFIDDQNIQKISLDTLRKNISLVSQDIVMFDDTIRANIAYADSDATEDEIDKACELAAVTEFINRFPKGYETNIGENGVRLSGGQKQRVSIARAVLKKSPIILLDEATSSLDAESEEIVQNAIFNLTKNKTTLVIAHRLSTILNADKIFVLNHGSIVGVGDHKYLINNSGEYKSLYEKQIK
jgi:subfamily B ATP-binding cassette protein MsbA